MSASPSQRRAITHREGPALVIAGPGSGKTLVITYRICYLIRKCHVRADRILVITFSRAAAFSMKERFRSLAEPGSQDVVFGTFHAIFYQILKNAYHFSAASIIREEQKYSLLEKLAVKAGLEEAGEKELPEMLASEISAVKNEQLPIEHYYSTSCNEQAFREIFAGYHRELRRTGLIDFDDMLVLVYELFRERKDILRNWQQKFQYILADEFQDINLLQYRILRMLAAPENNLFAVGDDDQSIYRFRGAKPEIMLGFAGDFPGAALLMLEENYRSCPGIIDAAGIVIRANTKRFEKRICSACRKTIPEEEETSRTEYVKQTAERGKPDLKAENAGGFRDTVMIHVYENPAKEAEGMIRKIRESAGKGVPLREMAVLTRTKQEGRYFAEQFLRCQIPFEMREMAISLYDHWITRDILAYLRLAEGPYTRKDFLRIMNHPLRYLSRASVEQETISFDSLRRYYDDRPWMTERIDRMEEDLMIMRRMRPFAAVNYLLRSAGYNEYLKEYAAERGMDAEELLQIAQELQENAARFSSRLEWENNLNESKKAMLAAQERTRRPGSSGPDAEGEDTDAVILATLHASKGLEFDEVYLPDVNEGILPWRKARLTCEIEEERRLLYVGMTRARKRLHISYVKDRFGRKMEPSSFLEDLQSQSASS